MIPHAKRQCNLIPVQLESRLVLLVVLLYLAIIMEQGRVSIYAHFHISSKLKLHDLAEFNTG